VANVGTVAPFGRFVSTSPWLIAAQSAGRWLVYAGLALLAGAAAACWIVFRGRLPHGGKPLLTMAWLLGAGGIAIVIVTERAIVRAPSLLPLFETTPGLVLLGQGTAVMVVCGLAATLAGAVPRRITLAALGLAVAIAMFSVVWASHANVPSPFRLLNVTLQWLHFAGVGVWVGGFAWLLLGLRGLGREQRAEASRRFSAIATVGLGIVLFTGLLRGVAEVGAPANLLHTSFGHVLLIKLVLFVALVFLGTRNHFVLVPDLGRSNDAAPRFRRAVRGELVLGVSILAVTGVLGGLAPAREAATAARASAASRVVLTGSDYATTVRVRLVVAPGTVGHNQFALSASNYASGRPLTGVRAVQLDFSLPSQTTVQPSTLILSKGPDNTWTAGGYELSVEGRWSMDVLIQQAATAVVVPLTIDARSPAG
jgi:putative copper export protein